METIRNLLILTTLLATAIKAPAQSFSYSVENSKTTITGFTAEPSGAVVVPATLGGYTVTEIGRSAFKGRSGITSISFASGASVTKLGPAAFQGCTGLQSITLPGGTLSLPAGLLQGCTRLTTATIPASVTAIGPMAFAGCSSLAPLTLPASLTTIGESAFSGCTSLASLAFPVGVTHLPAQLCDECRALASLDVAGNVTAIGENAFFHCASLVAVNLPDSVLSIGAGAFSDCQKLSSVTLGSGLAAIGANAFQGCGLLASITVAAGNATFSSHGGVLFNAAQTTLVLCPPALAGSYAVPAGVSALGNGAFAHCVGLTTVILPPGLQVVPDDAFYYATGLTELPVTQAVTSIGSWACAGLKGLTGLTLPSSVTALGDDAFHSSSALEWVIFRGNAPSAMGYEVFDAAAEDFGVYYYAGTSGFTNPLWQGYPASELNTNAAIVGWLTGNGYSPGTSPLADPNDDGVSLFTAYALGLDPSLNLSTAMPIPVLANGTLSLTFQGDRSGILYAAETSTDLITWTSEGVPLTAPDSHGMRTASITASPGSTRFLRLVIQATP